MRLLLKVTLKNIVRKPFRSLMVIGSLFLCAFVAIFCFDLGLTEADYMEQYFRAILGTSDIVFMTDDIDGFILPEGFPEHKSAVARGLREKVYLPIEGEYAYVSTRDLHISAIDLQVAKEMGLIGDLELNDDETVITDSVARDLNLKAGDMMTIHDNIGDPHEFKIKSVAHANERNILFRDYSCLITPEALKTLEKDPITSGVVLIDLDDDTLTAEAKEMLTELYPNNTIIGTETTDETASYLNELMGVLVLLFVIALLLVIFVTISTCERIVSDRMSFIGTLRSLGMRSSKTVFILLLENILYSILGAVPGVILYVTLRSKIFNRLYNGDIYYTPGLPKALPFLIVAGALIVECLIPLKFVIKAVRTPIRDIIFDNRDTEYKFSRAGIIIGIILAVAAIVTAFIKNTFVTAICVLCTVTALALLFPLILKGVSYLIVRISRKSGSERWRLAGHEVIARKSTVGSGILCVTTATMFILIAVIATGVIDEFNSDIYNCDVIVSTTEKPERYSFIEQLEGVKDIEYVYDTYDTVHYGNEEEDSWFRIIGIPEEGYKLYNALEGVPENMSEGQICVEKTWADERGISVGDKIKLTFDPRGVFPIEKEFDVVSFFRIDKFESLDNNIAISLSDFKSIYHETLEYILLNSEDPSATAKDIRKYGSHIIYKAQSKDEMLEEMEKDTMSFVRIMVIVILVALVTPCMGLISNQLIGFEGRKKECAILISTSMKKKTLAGIFFREMFITSVTSATAGAVASILLFLVLRDTLAHSEILALELKFHPTIVILMWLVISIIFALTVLFPIRQIRKMKLSEQLKYE